MPTLALPTPAAYAYYYASQYEKAIQDWTIAVDGLGNPAFALLGRAKAKWLSGQKEDACNDFKKAILLYKALEEKKEFIACD